MQKTTVFLAMVTLVACASEDDQTIDTANADLGSPQTEVFKAVVTNPGVAVNPCKWQGSPITFSRVGGEIAVGCVAGGVAGYAGTIYAGGFGAVPVCIVGAVGLPLADLLGEAIVRAGGGTCRMIFK